MDKQLQKWIVPAGIFGIVVFYFWQKSKGGTGGGSSGGNTFAYPTYTGNNAAPYFNSAGAISGGSIPLPAFHLPATGTRVKGKA